MDDLYDVITLKQRIAELELENAKLKNELDFLKTHPTITQGIKGETLVAKLVGGSATSYSDSYDVTTSTGLRIEVKYRKLNQPMKSSHTRRWNWSKPLGWLDKGKDYHYLLLIGEKDLRHLDQYPDKTPYVYFLIPIAHVPEVMVKGKSIGGMIQTTTDLIKLQSKTNKPKLLSFQVSFEHIKQFFENAINV